MKYVEAHIAVGGLFHARRAATENARSPKVESRMRGTVRVEVADEQRRLWPSASVARQMHSARQQHH